MADIVMGAPLDLSRPHGKHRLGPIERLDLAFLVDAPRWMPTRNLMRRSGGKPALRSTMPV